MALTIFDPTQLPSSQLNVIDNGGFEIWQRGTTFSNPTGYHADRWNISTSCTTYSIAQESGAANIDSGLFSCKCVITTAAGGVFRIGQVLENPGQYVGKTVTFSARVKSNVAGVKMLISYVGGQTAGAIGHTGGNTFETLSLTFVVPATGLTCSIGFDSVNTTSGTSVSPSAGTYYVDSVCFVVGSQIASYIPFPLEIDLARCQRFYEIGTFFDTKAIQRDSTPRNRTRANTAFKVTKVAVPTVTATLTGVTLTHLPTTGAAESVDTANWTISGGGTVDKLTATAQRNTDQTTFPITELSFSWTASADF